MNSQTYLTQTPQYNDNDSAGMDTLSTSDPISNATGANHPAAMHQAINKTINSHKGKY